MNTRQWVVFLAMMGVAVMLRGARETDKVSAESVYEIVSMRTGRGGGGGS